MDMLSYLVAFFLLHLCYNGCHGKDEVSLEISISKDTVKPGEQTVVTCKVIYPLDLSFMMQWKRRLAGHGTVDLATNLVPIDRFKRYVIEQNTTEDTQAQTYTSVFVMTIEESKLEDSGEIGCIIPRSDTKKIVEKYTKLTVLANVKSLVIKTSVDGSDELEETFDSEDGELIMEEDEKRTFRCEVKGSYPAPEVAVKFGDKDVTKLFENAENPAYKNVGDKADDVAKLIIDKAREIKGYEVMLKTIDPMVVNYTFNNKMLNCVATLPDNIYPQSTVSVHLKLKGFKPHFLCENTKTAEMHEVNVTILCKVTASPPVDHIRFYWKEENGEDDNSSIILVPGTKNGLYLADVFEDKDELEHTVMSLRIDRLSDVHFRTYFFEVSNNYTSKPVIHRIELKLKEKDGKQQQSASGASNSAAKVGAMLGPACTALLLLIACLSFV